MTMERTKHQEGSSIYRIREITPVSELEALKGAWADLVTRAANPGYMHEYTWWHAVSTQLLSGQVTYYCVYDNDRLIAIVPLEERTRGIPLFRIRWLQLPTHVDFYLNDILLDQSYQRHPILEQLLKHIYHQGRFRWDFCRLRKFSEHSALGRQARDGGSFTRKINDYVFVPCGGEDDLRNMSKKNWKNVARLTRKAETDFGSVTMRSSDSGPTGEQLYQQFLATESSGWKGSDGTATSLASNPAMEHFFRTLFVHRGSDWHARVFLLRFAETAVAAMLAIRTGATWYVLKIGYSDEYKAYGPGSILIQQFIELAAADPAITEINLTTAPEWAARWHFQRASLLESFYFSPSILAKVSQVYFRFRKTAALIRAKGYASPLFREATH